MGRPALFKIFKKFFSPKKEKPKTDFSDFFINASPEKKAEAYKKAVQKANEEQNELLKKWGKAQS